MNTASKTLAVLFAIIGLVALSGCSTAIGEGVGLVKGPDGTFVTVRAATSTSSFFLSDYTQFELGNFSDDTGRNVPMSFMGHLQSVFPRVVADRDLPNYAGKTLVLRGTILHYEGEGLVGKIIGPIEQVIVRAEMVDKESGQVLTTANVVGRTTSRINLGVDKKALGLARGLVAWIQKYRPEGN